MTSIANVGGHRRTSTSIGKRRSNGLIANGDAFDHEERFGGQNGRHSQNREAEVPDKRRSRQPQAPQRLPRVLRGHFSTPRDDLMRKRDAHRSTFLTTDGGFAHKRAGAGQTRRPLQNTASNQQGAGPTAVPPARQLGSNSSSAQINQFLTYALRTLTSIGARSAHAIKFIGKQTKRRKTHGKRYHERRKQNRELHDRPLSANAKAPIVCSPREFRERIKPLSTSAGKVQFVGIIMSHERKTHAKRRSKMKFNF